MPSVGAVLNRVHPDQDAIEAEQLGGYVVDQIILIHDALGGDVELRECVKQGGEHGVAPLGALASSPVSSPEETDFQGGGSQIVTMLTTSVSSVSTARSRGHSSVRTDLRKAASSPRHTYVSTGDSTSFGLTTGMGSSFSADVLPASRQTRIDTPTVREINNVSVRLMGIRVKRA